MAAGAEPTPIGPRTPPTTPGAPWREGWPLVAAASGIVAIAGAVVLAPRGVDVEGLRAVIRLTARTSLVLFLGAFTASALFRLRPSPLTRWLRRNRRYLGVSFAASHTMHLAAIVTMARVDPQLFWTNASTTALVAGGFGYVLIAAMVATSFDRAVTWLGPRRWRWLHTFGLYYLWAVFLLTYGAAGRLATLPEVAALLAGLGLRLTARRR